MGYYQGNGCIASGGSTVGVFEHFAFYGAHNVYQQHTTTTRRRSGVSLSVAQNEKSECNMVTHQFTWGSCFHWSPNCKGTIKNVQYTQINGSNLYELLVTNDTIKAKLDEQNWVS